MRISTLVAATLSLAACGPAPKYKTPDELVPDACAIMQGTEARAVTADHSLLPSETLEEGVRNEVTITEDVAQLEGRLLYAPSAGFGDYAIYTSVPFAVGVEELDRSVYTARATSTSIDDCAAIAGYWVFQFSSSDVAVELSSTDVDRVDVVIVPPTLAPEE